MDRNANPPIHELALLPFCPFDRAQATAGDRQTCSAAGAGRWARRVAPCFRLSAALFSGDCRPSLHLVELGRGDQPMSQREDHIVLTENVKPQQLDQVLALFERGIQHDHP